MELEKEIQEIKNRNLRVETDKAWEVSWTRKAAISIITYIVAIIWLYLINEENFLLKAFVPVIGYVLSTLTLPLIKKNWSKKYESI